MIYNARSARYSAVASLVRFVAGASLLVHLALTPFVFALLVIIFVPTSAPGKVPAGTVLMVAAVALLLIGAVTYGSIARVRAVRGDAAWRTRPVVRGVATLLSPIGATGLSVAMIVTGVAGIAVSMREAPLAMVAAAMSFDVAALGVLSLTSKVAPITRRRVGVVPVDREITLVLPRLGERRVVWLFDDPLTAGSLGRGVRFDVKVNLSKARYLGAAALPRERRAPQDVLRLSVLDENPELRNITDAVVAASAERGLGPIQTLMNICACATAMARIVDTAADGTPVGTKLRTPTETVFAGEGEWLDLCALAHALLARSTAAGSLFWKATPLGGLEGRMAVGIPLGEGEPGPAAVDRLSGRGFMLLEPVARPGPIPDLDIAGPRQWRWLLVPEREASGFIRVMP